VNKLESYTVNHLRKYYDFIKKKRKQNLSIEEFYGSELLSPEEGNDKIAELLDSSTPLMVARFGSFELAIIDNYIQIERYNSSNKLGKYIRLIKGDINYWHNYIKNKYSFSLLPSDDEDLEKFSIDFINHSRNIDILGAWLFEQEKYVYKSYFPEATLIPLTSIEPYFHKEPWSRKLKGKKVLVIHPFEESIINQYRRREYLFNNKNILPEFDLQTVKAVLDLSNNSKSEFRNWHEAYDYMCEKIINKDFDIAIIGAGHFGIPLASFIKSQGKKAIQMGGATQIFFGIKGKRWDNHDIISGFFNESWTRPLPSETPENYKILDDGCYW
jgi:hypothetical protein